jgi:DNA-binding response OmpR family regulator
MYLSQVAFHAGYVIRPHAANWTGGTDPMAEVNLNLGGVKALIVDDDTYSVTLLSSILRGFDLRAQTIVPSCERAKELLRDSYFDVCICNADLPGEHGAELVRWIRRREGALVRFAPVIVVTGYAKSDAVFEARDSGANIVLKRPISPQSIYDRIDWVTRHERAFIECDNYVGPDRRHRSLGPPDGKERRRRNLVPERNPSLDDGKTVVEL